MIQKIQGPRPHASIVSAVPLAKVSSALTSDNSVVQRFEQKLPSTLAWPGKSQIRFGRDPYIEEVEPFLGRTFANAGQPPKNYTLGDILLYLYDKSGECDGQEGPGNYPVKGKYYTSRYTYVLDTELNFRSDKTRADILDLFTQLNLFTPGIEGPWDRVHLSAFGRKVAEALKNEKPKSNLPVKINKPDENNSNANSSNNNPVSGNNPPQGTPPDGGNKPKEPPDDGHKPPRGNIEYLTPPVDLTGKDIQEVFRLVPFKPEVRSKIEERFRIMRSGDGTEGNKARTWLKNTLSLPWLTETKDNVDIKLARDILDRDFYGMDRLKRRVIREVAKRKQQGGNQGGIILLVGPPGTGKTAVAKALSEAMGRKFVRRSLAGINDATKVTGHDYTYVGSKPGLIMDAIREAGTLNPVFQIDEMDKVGRGGLHGNPHDALLAALDPQQNHAFTDSYLDFPFDLSKVLFVCTANRLEDFPAPLLSRTEIIRFDAYLPDEKMEIAKRHLVPKQYQEFNLTPEQLKFQPEAIKRIIQNYTLEGGVRKLEQRIREIFGEACLYKEENPEENTIMVTPERVDQWLTNPVYKKSVEPKELRQGVVNGLYYSEAGGGILPVQVSAAAGRGKLLLTGSLGDVMKEAAQVAVSYIKQNGDALGLSPEQVKRLQDDKVDIHIHYPDGATPKDGPSAGTSTFTALWSSLSEKPVPAGVAMTGEIDLKGNVTAIGGVLEKVSGAILQGVNTIYLPKDNEKDFRDLCERSQIFKRMVTPVEVKFVTTAKELVDDITRKSIALEPKPAAQPQPKTDKGKKDDGPKFSGNKVVKLPEPGRKGSLRLNA